MLQEHTTPWMKGEFASDFAYAFSSSWAVSVDQDWADRLGLANSLHFRWDYRH